MKMKYMKEIKNNNAKYDLDFNKLAIILYDFYNDSTKEGFNRQHQDFNDLSENIQRANLKQVEFIHEMLKSINYEIVPLNDKREEVENFSYEELQDLAKVQHDEWVQEYILEGWSYGYHKDINKKMNQYLVPWRNLPEFIQDKVLELIENIPKILKIGGMKIVKS